MDFETFTIFKEFYFPLQSRLHMLICLFDISFDEATLFHEYVTPFSLLITSFGEFVNLLGVNKTNTVIANNLKIRFPHLHSSKV